MSLFETKSFQCPECGENSSVDIWQSINVTDEPEARELLLEGKINVFICPQCEYKALITTPLMYHDMDRKFCIQYFPFEAIDYNEVLLQFEPDGTINTETFKGLPIPEYMRTRHIVFSMDEMIRYILFREKLLDYYG